MIAVSKDERRGVAMRTLMAIAGRLPESAIETLCVTAKVFQSDEEDDLPWPFCRGALQVGIDADRLIVHPGRSVEMRVRFSLGSLSFTREYRRGARGKWCTFEGREQCERLQWQLELSMLEALSQMDEGIATEW